MATHHKKSYSGGNIAMVLKREMSGGDPFDTKVKTSLLSQLSQRPRGRSLVFLIIMFVFFTAAIIGIPSIFLLGKSSVASTTDQNNPETANRVSPAPVTAPPSNPANAWKTLPQNGFIVPVFSNNLLYALDASEQNGEFLDSLLGMVVNTNATRTKFLIVLNFENGPGPLGTACAAALTTRHPGAAMLLNGLAPYKDRVKVLGYTPACWGFEYVILNGTGTWQCTFDNGPTVYPSIQLMMQQWGTYNCTTYGPLDGIYIDQAWAFGGFPQDYDRFFGKIRPLMPSTMGDFLAVNPGFLGDGIETWFRNDTNTNGFDLVGVVENAYEGLVVNGSYYDRFLGTNGLAPTVANRSQTCGFVHSTGQIAGTNTEDNAKNAATILSTYRLGWWYITDNAYYSLPSYWDNELGGCSPGVCKTFVSTTMRPA
ncbi:hypothetical protein M427DRAFT_60973 [Gonapodya prolifera JEL478]|uniref:Uncharacterized protein n=1 Tax=Gonapodya prolifera (strain JEL478) TaxID=1344416 RepID=A0A139A385_GONPJ|nr:hypothetical protein M427DRAFT_60973 [Gonapodya prolifera JEL478]|eukprot:KXS11174.1 hypothetical protein M427DRAFT_60973 [Gonapodya prolifera JEL478]